MKSLITIAFLLLCGAVSAQEFVPGYFRKDGTFVQGYYKTIPNKTKVDNYSSKPNINPYTGKEGKTDPYKYPEPTPTYSAPATQCLGITKKGEQCKRMTKNISGYCASHL